MSLYVDADDESLREDAFEKIEDYELDIMAFYDKGEGYFYLIDEEAGVPVVSQLDSCYPLVIKEPGPIVRNLLLLMLVGMIQMRGQKALSILATSLLDDSITIVPQHWSHTAKAVERQLLSTKLNEDSEDYNEVRELQEGHMQLNSHDSSKQERSSFPSMEKRSGLQSCPFSRNCMPGMTTIRGFVA